MITRIYACRMLSEWRELKSKIDAEGHGDKWLKFGGLKAFVDGALGSHTAAFLSRSAIHPKTQDFLSP